MPRPRGGDWLEVELRNLHRSGVERLLSALQWGEVWELGLVEEEVLAGVEGIAFASVPIVDRGVPEDRRGFEEVVEEAARGVERGEWVVCHCRQGIGRATMLAVGVLVCLGVEVEQALARIEAARGREVPDTDAQRAWLVEWASGRAARAS